MARDFIKGIKKNVFVLGLVSFFTDISSEMLYPIIPMFLTSVLNAPMSIVGVIEGIAESTAASLKWFPAGCRIKPGSVNLLSSMGMAFRPLQNHSWHLPPHGISFLLRGFLTGSVKGCGHRREMP